MKSEHNAGGVFSPIPSDFCNFLILLSKNCPSWLFPDGQFSDIEQELSPRMVLLPFYLWDYRVNYRGFFYKFARALFTRNSAKSATSEIGSFMPPAIHWFKMPLQPLAAKRYAHSFCSAERFFPSRTLSESVIS